MVKGFRFEHFKPSAELAVHANALLMSMIDYIPAGEISEAVVKKSHGTYLCELAVQGKERSFVQDNSSHDPKAAVDRAGEGLIKQMRNWQLEHFAVDELNLEGFKELDSSKIAENH
jgi:hypothetical protein